MFSNHNDFARTDAAPAATDLSPLRNRIDRRLVGIRALATALSTLLVLVGAPARAHLPLGKQVAAFQFPAGTEPVIDGRVDDWTILGAPTLTSTDFIDLRALAVGAESVVDPGDLAIEAWIGWSPNTDRLYVAARVRDDIHQVDRPDGTATDGQIFVDDDMEVFVDGDHSGGQYADFDDLTQAEQLALNGAQATWFVLGGPHPDGDFFVNFSAAGWYSLENGPYTQAALTSESLQAGAIVNYEFGFAVFDEVNMAADFLSRRRPLVAGDVLGFNLEFTDYDQLSDTFDAKWSLSGGFNAFRLADRFTDLVLSDLEEPFRPTSIRASTWGQIKSTFDPLKTLY